MSNTILARAKRLDNGEFVEGYMSYAREYQTMRMVVIHKPEV